MVQNWGQNRTLNFFELGACPPQCRADVQACCCPTTGAPSLGPLCSEPILRESGEDLVSRWPVPHYPGVQQATAGGRASSQHFPYIRRDYWVCSLHTHSCRSSSQQISPIIIPLFTNRKTELSVICLRAHSKLTAELGLKPRCWAPDLANLLMVFGGTVSQDRSRSQDQPWGQASGSSEPEDTRTVSQWMKPVSRHSTQEIRPFLFIVFCIDQKFCTNQFHVHNQTK